MALYGSLENIRILQKLRHERITWPEKLAILGLPTSRKARVFKYFDLFGRKLDIKTVDRALKHLQILPDDVVSSAPTAFSISLSLLYISYSNGCKPENDVQRAFTWAKAARDPGILPDLLGFRRRAKPDQVRNLVTKLLGEERNE